MEAKEDFAKHIPISGSEIFWKKKSGKKILIKRKGDFCSKRFFTKYLDKNMTLVSSPTESCSWDDSFSELIDELRVLAEDFRPIGPQSLFNWRTKFLNFINDSLNCDDSQVSEFTLCYSVSRCFYCLSDENEERFQKLPKKAQIKASLMASYAMIIAICIGYVDLKFLRQLYNTYLFSDFYFIDEMWSDSEFSLLNSLNENKLDSSLNKKYIKKLNEIKEQLSEEDNIPLSIRFLELRFHNLNLNGNKDGMDPWSFDDLDCLGIFLINTVVYKDEFSITGESNHFKTLLKRIKNNQKFISQRIFRMLQSSFTGLSKGDDLYLELGGL